MKGSHGRQVIVCVFPPSSFHFLLANFPPLLASHPAHLCSQSKCFHVLKIQLGSGEKESDNITPTDAP